MRSTPIRLLVVAAAITIATAPITALAHASTPTARTSTFTAEV